MISATGKRTPHWKWLKIKTCVILCSNEPKGPRLVYWSNHIIGETKFIHTFGLLTSEHWVHPFKVTKWLLEIQAPPVDTNFWPKTSSLQPSLIERKSFPEPLDPLISTKSCAHALASGEAGRTSMWSLRPLCGRWTLTVRNWQ